MRLLECENLTKVWVAEPGHATAARKGWFDAISQSAFAPVYY